MTSRAEPVVVPNRQSSPSFKPTELCSNGRDVPPSSSPASWPPFASGENAPPPFPGWRIERSFRLANKRCGLFRLGYCAPPASELYGLPARQRCGALWPAARRSHALLPHSREWPAGAVGSWFRDDRERWSPPLELERFLADVALRHPRRVALAQREESQMPC
jgi:hypothetical protein